MRRPPIDSALAAAERLQGLLQGYTWRAERGICRMDDIVTFMAQPYWDARGTLEIPVMIRPVDRRAQIAFRGTIVHLTGLDDEGGDREAEIDARGHAVFKGIAPGDYQAHLEFPYGMLWETPTDAITPPSAGGATGGAGEGAGSSAVVRPVPFPSRRPAPGAAPAHRLSTWDIREVAAASSALNTLPHTTRAWKGGAILATIIVDVDAEERQLHVATRHLSADGCVVAFRWGLIAEGAEEPEERRLLLAPLAEDEPAERDDDRVYSADLNFGAVDPVVVPLTEDGIDLIGPWSAEDLRGPWDREWLAAIEESIRLAHPFTRDTWARLRAGRRIAPAARKAIVEALIRIDDAQARALLGEVVADDAEDDDIRAAAAAAVRVKGTERADS